LFFVVVLHLLLDLVWSFRLLLLLLLDFFILLMEKEANLANAIRVGNAEEAKEILRNNPTIDVNRWKEAGDGKYLLHMAS